MYEECCMLVIKLSVCLSVCDECVCFHYITISLTRSLILGGKPEENANEIVLLFTIIQPRGNAPIPL